MLLETCRIVTQDESLSKTAKLGRRFCQDRACCPVMRTLSPIPSEPMRNIQVAREVKDRQLLEAHQPASLAKFASNRFREKFCLKKRSEELLKKFPNSDL